VPNLHRTGVIALCLAGLAWTARPAGGAEEVLEVTFKAGAETPYVELLATYLELAPPRRGAPVRTWRFRPGARGDARSYARLFGALPTVASVHPAPGPIPTPAPWLEGELLVKLRDDVPAERVQAFHAAQGVRVVSVISGIGVAHLAWSHGASVPEMMKRYQDSGLFGYVEPNRRVSIPEPPAGAELSPRDLSIRLRPGHDPAMLARVLGVRLVATASPDVATLRTRAEVSPRTLEAILPLCPAVQEVLPTTSPVW